MHYAEDSQSSKGIRGWLTANSGRLLISLFVPALTFFILWQGFLFLRDSNQSKYLIAVVAIIWGVGGVATLFYVSNWMVEQLSDKWKNRLLPFVFVGPAIAILTWYLVIPTLRTFSYSFYDLPTLAKGLQPEFWVGLDNYVYAFTNPGMLESFRNNILWLVFGTGGSVGLGLLIAILADRSNFEKLAKSLVFMPMAISFVGAGVIFRFMYAFKPVQVAQIGLLNAIWVGMGNDPIGWLTRPPWNTFFLIIILVWMQTGFAMVILSAAIKGVPSDLLEAGRIDGANEVHIFFRIIIPMISGSILTVTTSIVIITLKIFDIVWTMTNGLNSTEVIATMQFRQMFKFFNYGRGSAVAIVLLITVIPVMYYNLRQFGKQEAF